MVMREPHVLVRMAVRLHHGTLVRVLVVLVVDVQMVVLGRLMRMNV